VSFANTRFSNGGTIISGPANEEKGAAPGSSADSRDRGFEDQLFETAAMAYNKRVALAGK
jgi:hypothetical protein